MSWDQIRTRLALVASVSEGLALVLVTGPDYRAEEGLARLVEAIPADRPRLWHRLDRDGPTLAAQLGGDGEPVLLVHGLQYLETPRRTEMEARLNLLRDTLVARRTLLLLWIPGSRAEEFRQHCADLFQWRTLLLELGEADVPIDPALEARRRYLAELLERTLSLHAIAWKRRLLSPWSHELSEDPLTEGNLDGKALLGWVEDRLNMQTLDADSEREPRLWAPEIFRYVVGMGRFLRRAAPKKGWEVSLSGLQMVTDSFYECVSALQWCVRWLARAALDSPAMPLPVVAGFLPTCLTDVEAAPQVIEFDLGDEHPSVLRLRSRPAPNVVPPLRVALVPGGAYQWLLASHLPLGWSSFVGDQTTMRFFPSLWSKPLRYGDPRREQLAGLQDILNEAPLPEGPLSREELVTELATVALRRLTQATDTAAESEPLGEQLETMMRLLSQPRSKQPITRHPAWPNGWFSADLLDGLAALALVAQGVDAAIDTLDQQEQDPRWEPVLAMALGRLARQSGPEFLWQRVWPGDDDRPMWSRLRRMALALVAAGEAFLPPEQIAPYRAEAEAAIDALPADNLEAARDLAAALALF